MSALLPTNHSGWQGSVTPQNSCRRDMRPDAGDVLLANGLAEEALPYLERRYRQEPNGWLAVANYGLCLMYLDRLEEALPLVERGVKLSPPEEGYITNLGYLYAHLGRFSDALHCYAEAFRQKSNNRQVQANYGFELMRFGNWEAGLFLWESGRYGGSWKAPEGMAVYLDQPLEGKRLLVVREGGYGDVFCFMRYLPEIAAKGCEITMTVWDRQVSLLEEWGEVFNIVPESKVQGLRADDFDYITATCSLPYVAGAWPERIPQLGPYLGADNTKVAHFGQLLPTGNKPKIGLCWDAEECATVRRIRSLDARSLLPLKSAIDAHWISLTPGRQAPEWVLDYTPELKDWSDTAGLVENLDLVVTVDTAVAHLAAAMGKPVWMLVPKKVDWKWGTPEKPRSWYPSMRVFYNDSFRNWETLVATVAAELVANIGNGLAAPVVAASN